MAGILCHHLLLSLLFLFLTVVDLLISGPVSAICDGQMHQPAQGNLVAQQRPPAQLSSKQGRRYEEIMAFCSFSMILTLLFS
ncbi:hypothetical protein QBC41DRAFT_324556 [Cercophora samala]|uniref:Uncharacterized protein n=1 Tax=Cercophora samala TaxID=330535 RepID=A0AA39ZA40_9PEZI|nr:hypothetical protein QBC41DRAFT_324556 [Cercophora samala]